MMVTDQYADLESAREFADLLRAQISAEFPTSLTLRLRQRREKLSQLVESGLRTPGSLEELLSSFFGVRRRVGQIIASNDREELLASIEKIALGPVQDELPRVAISDPGLSKSVGLELSHAFHPDHVALWTEWVWDPAAETGALKLLVDEETDLFGDSDYEILEKVNHVSTYLRYTFDAAGLSVDQADPFSLDVFLAGVYAVYTRTVLQLRLTKEFNRLLPETHEFMSRILGFRREG